MTRVLVPFAIAVLAAASLAASHAQTAPPADRIAAERAENDAAFAKDYALHKERLFAEHAGQWIAIVHGKILPAPERGFPIAPAATLADCLKAADARLPDAAHRYVFRLGEEGDVAYSLGMAQHPDVFGMALFDLVGINVFATGVVDIERKGKKGKLAFTNDLGGALTLATTIADPTGAKEEPIKVVASTGFNGIAVFAPAVADRLGLARFEIPGRAAIEGWAQKGYCRRARFRMKQPEIDVDEVLPAAIWPK